MSYKCHIFVYIYHFQNNFAQIILNFGKVKSKYVANAKINVRGMKYISEYNKIYSSLITATNTGKRGVVCPA